MASDGINYEDVVVITTLKKREVKPAIIETITPAVMDGETIITPAATKEIEPASYELYLDLPFQPYSETVMCEGKDITYSYRSNIDLDGKEVMAAVSYMKKPVHHLTDDTEKAMKFSGRMDKPLEHPLYTKHCNLTVATLKSVTDTEGNLTEYKGTDASKPVPFCLSNAMQYTSDKVEQTVEENL